MPGTCSPCRTPHPWSPRGRDLGVQRPAQYRLGQVSLGGELHVIRDSCLTAPGRVSDPGFRQVQLDYRSGAAEACQFRDVLKRLTLIGVAGAGSPAVSVIVVSLISDRRALALGPQLAAFAASLGIPPRSLSALTTRPALPRTCWPRAPPIPRSGSSDQLRVGVADHYGCYSQPEATLTVVVAAIDGQAAWVADTILLSASSISATMANRRGVLGV
jgi:hypothetical protein